MNNAVANNFQFWVQKNLYKNGLEVGITCQDNVGKDRWVASPLCMTQITPEMEGSIMYPAMVLTKEAAQNLMDELWNSGVRPSNGAGSVGELAATQAHLKDMREMVAAFMELKK